MRKPNYRVKGRFSSEVAPDNSASARFGRLTVAISAKADNYGGWWRFAVLGPGGKVLMAEADREPGASPERLELLALVRALEALDQPSAIRLVTRNPYISEGLIFGLPEWRQNGWRWEWFGQMVPVRHADLWQRVDRALAFHDLVVELRRVDFANHATLAGPHFLQVQTKSSRIRRTLFSVTPYGISTDSTREVQKGQKPSRSWANKAATLGAFVWLGVGLFWWLLQAVGPLMSPLAHILVRK